MPLKLPQCSTWQVNVKEASSVETPSEGVLKFPGSFDNSRHIIIDKATPNQLLVSHPIQFPPTCEFGFLNFSEAACSVKHTLRHTHVVEFWQRTALL